MIDRIDNEIGFQRTALNLRAYRQELLASNIANADTPNYKARDVDFKSALNDALSGKGSGQMARTQAGHIPPVEIRRTQPGHLAGQPDGGPFAASLKYRAEFQGAVDGNTVNMDVERAAFAENSVQYEAMLTFINGRFKTLASAIQGQ